MSNDMDTRVVDIPSDDEEERDVSTQAASDGSQDISQADGFPLEDSANLMKKFERIIVNIEAGLQCQREKLDALNKVTESMPREIEKLKNACTQAEVACQVLPEQVRKETSEIYRKTLEQAQVNCNSFNRQLSAWLKERDKAKDRNINCSLRRLRNIIIGMIVWQIILSGYVIWRVLR